MFLILASGIIFIRIEHLSKNYKCDFKENLKYVIKITGGTVLIYISIKCNLVTI